MIVKMWRVSAWVCVLQALVLRACAGSSVLAVFPVPGSTHTGLGDSVVRTLLEAGHEVTYVSASRSLAPRPRLTVLDISAQAGRDKERLSLMELVRSPRPPQRILELGVAFARRALEHNATQQLLADKEQSFDLVVAEWFYSGLLSPLAFVYKCPLVWYSAADASWPSLQLMHSSPTYSADPQARSSPADLSVGERATRLWRQIYLTGWIYYMTYYVEAPIYDKIFRGAMGQRGHALPDYESLVYNGSMLLFNSHPLVGQALTLPQNAKYVGGHHIEVPTKPLPKNLQNLLDRSTKGIIFFNLGSNIKRKHLPERMQKKLLDLFGQLEQTVIWKFEETLMGVPRNVHVMKQAPQTSILKHTNTVLLVTHGGFVSCMEATFFGVPIIGIPLFGDQFLTVDLAVARGRGIRVDFAEDLPYRIYDAVHKILGDVSYQSNAQQAKAIFRCTLVPPARELLHWIELVLHHGALHLRSPTFQLSTFQKLHLDILTLFVMFLWFSSKVIKVIRVHWRSDDMEEERKNQ